MTRKLPADIPSPEKRGGVRPDVIGERDLDPQIVRDEPDPAIPIPHRSDNSE